MADLTLIKNQNLRNIIKKSKRFQSLPDEDQNKYIDRMKNLPPKQQMKMMDFFVNENEKEEKILSEVPAEDEKQNQLLMEFLKELEDLKQKYTKLALQDRENMQSGNDEKEKENLLQELNTI